MGEEGPARTVAVAGPRRTEPISQRISERISERIGAAAMITIGAPGGSTTIDTIGAHLEELADTVVHISRGVLLSCALCSAALWCLIILVAARIW